MLQQKQQDGGGIQDHGRGSSCPRYVFVSSRPSTMSCLPGGPATDATCVMLIRNHINGRSGDGLLGSLVYQNFRVDLILLHEEPITLVWELLVLYFIEDENYVLLHGYRSLITHCGMHAEPPTDPFEQHK